MPGWLILCGMHCWQEAVPVSERALAAHPSDARLSSLRVRVLAAVKVSSLHTFLCCGGRATGRITSQAELILRSRHLCPRRECCERGPG
jgi:hypothetical protein